MPNLKDIFSLVFQLQFEISINEDSTFSDERSLCACVIIISFLKWKKFETQFLDLKNQRKSTSGFEIQD